MDLASSGVLYAGIAAAFGAIGMFWGYIKTFLSNISSLIVVKVKVKNLDSFHSVNCYAFNNLKPTKIGMKTYQALSYFSKKTEKNQLIPFEIIDQSTFFWDGWKPILISTTGKEKNTSLNDPEHSEITIQFIRGMFNADDFVEKCVDYYNLITSESRENFDRYQIHYIIGKDKGGNEIQHYGPYRTTVIYRPIGHNVDEIGNLRTKNAFSNLAYPSHIHHLVKEAHFWKNNKEWFKNRKIPWKRGILVYGRPGTGKTSLGKAMAQDMNMPIFVFDLSSLNNKEFKEGWDGMKRHTPCMALIEDVDSVFEGRKNIFAENRNNGCLSFDMLLNCMDGVEDSDGIFIFITTNNIDMVDSALGGTYGNKPLGTRPGRIDAVVELKEIDREGALFLCQRILPDNESDWNDIIEEALKKNETAAQFQNRCRILATERFFQKNHN